jgi:aspartate/methionine/tyrosine aminotransferase
MGSPIGAYTSNSKGYEFSRVKIAEFISKRDGVNADPDHIYMTNGASEACKLGLSFLIRDEKDGLFLPTPSYPLYGAKIQMSMGTSLNYVLEEENDWAVDTVKLEENILKAKEEGITVRGMVVINPGNPTGHVLTIENMKEIINVCYKHSVVLLCDEVY